jgi:hypothetical protein
VDARSYWSQLILWGAMGVCVGVSLLARASALAALPWSFVELCIALGACAYVAFSDGAGLPPHVSMRTLQRVLYPVAAITLLIIAISFLGSKAI